MAKRILLYGATGYSGRLIAAEAKRQIAQGADYEVVLGGRNAIALALMTADLHLPFVVFGLNSRATVDSVLSQFHVVLNAAGPFAETGIRLAKSAISVGCQYVDINGEIDVYQQMDDLARTARDRDVRLVSGAGFAATVSDVMVHWALALLKVKLGPNGKQSWDGKRLGAIRLAVSAMASFSRGSVATMMRSVREEVTFVRSDKYVHIPVGRLERAFDFGVTDPCAPIGVRVASAANLIDTCVAFQTTRHQEVTVDTIESYIEMPFPVRVGYQVGAWSSVFLHLPLVRSLNQLQIDQLPEGPTPEERQKSRHVIVLQIDSPYHEPWVHWRIETPNSYDVTARCALAVADNVTIGPLSPGWLTPSEVLRSDPPQMMANNAAVETDQAIDLSGIFEGCTLEGRPVMAPV